MRETASFTGTQMQEIIDGLDRIYAGLDEAQKAWKAASPFPCADGCGSCCVDFEPDVLESEALYLAAWMIFHQRERAEAVLDGTFVSPREGSSFASRGCPFFDPSTPYHCTVYEGRPLICRLFGYSGDRGKAGLPRWKPCKFIQPASTDTDLRHQYEESELLERFGAVPPVMADIASSVLALTPDAVQRRLPFGEALPEAIGKILLLQRFMGSAPEPDAPEPNPEAPMPRAS